MTVSVPDGSLKLGADGKVKGNTGADLTGIAEVKEDVSGQAEVGADGKVEVSPRVTVIWIRARCRMWCWQPVRSTEGLSVPQVGLLVCICRLMGVQAR